MILSSRLSLSLSLVLVVSSVSCKSKTKKDGTPVTTVTTNTGTTNTGTSTNTAADELKNNPLLATCQATTTCSQELPKLDAVKGFTSIHNKAITFTGFPLHRGRDVIAVPGKPIWIQAKFAYGLADADLKGEPVDIYLSQGCNTPLKKIGQVTTTNDGQHETVDGVVDSGGRVYAELSTLGVAQLPIGRHRVVLVVPADNTTTELFIDVVDPVTKVAVSDIDGTLTSSELASATDLAGITPDVHPGAAEAITALYKKGYHILYLTARGEWFMEKTRAWLNLKNFPPGAVVTTQSKIGLMGDPASQYKIAEIAILKKNTAIVPSIAFGNKVSDVAAFGTSGIAPATSYYYSLVGDAGGGVSHSNYNDLKTQFDTLKAVCQ